MSKLGSVPVRSSRWIRSHLFTRFLGALVPLLARLSPRAWSFFAWILTPIVWKCMRKKRLQTIANLQNVLNLDLEDAKRIGRASFHSNLLVLFESLALQRLLDQDGVVVEAEITPQAAKLIEDLKTGKIKSALALSGHSGVWEFVGAYLACLVLPAPTIVASKLPRSPVSAKFLKDIRAGYGLTLVNKNQIARQFLKQQQDESSALTIFLCDQHFNREGAVRVPLLGKPACTVGMPATIIQKFGTPTIIGNCIRKKPGHYLIKIETLDVAGFGNLSPQQAHIAITARINEELSGYIESAPEQWFWGHRRWRECCSAKSD
ncbi:MAG: lysophospholipid acyltransferase family protein [Bdellovibrionales bacterium]|nr:lysophospholipid acyltransferase family protein [Bdellovibrionales bacterium]